MKRARHHLSPWQVYADQLLLLIGATLMMLMLLIPITNPPATHKKADAPKAEFLITLSWDDKRDVDLDLWLKADDCVIYYLNRECPNIALDRDFTGLHFQPQAALRRQLCGLRQPGSGRYPRRYARRSHHRSELLRRPGC